jgi:hypothetical protein
LSSNEREPDTVPTVVMDDPSAGTMIVRSLRIAAVPFGESGFKAFSSIVMIALLSCCHTLQKLLLGDPPFVLLCSLWRRLRFHPPC